MSANRRSFHLRNRIIIAPYDRNPRRLRRIVSGLLEIEGPADISRSFLSPITPIIRQIEGLSVRGDPGVNSEEQIEAPDTSLLDWDFSPAPETPFRPRQTLSSTRMVFGTPITTTAIGISTTASATTSTNPLNSGTPETPEIPTLPSRNAHDINFRPIVFTSGSFTFTPSAPVTAICTSIVNLTTLSTNTTTSISPPASNTTTETTSTFTANRPIPTIEISPSSNFESEQQLTNTMSIPSGSTAPRASFDVLFSSLPELKCESHSINQFIFVCDLIYDEYFKSDDFSRDRYYIRLLALKIPQEIFGRLGGMAYDSLSGCLPNSLQLSNTRMAVRTFANAIRNDQARYLCLAKEFDNLSGAVIFAENEIRRHSNFRRDRERPSSRLESGNRERNDGSNTSREFERGESRFDRDNVGTFGGNRFSRDGTSQFSRASQHNNNGNFTHPNNSRQHTNFHPGSRGFQRNDGAPSNQSNSSHTQTNRDHSAQHSSRDSGASRFFNDSQGNDRSSFFNPSSNSTERTFSRGTGSRNFPSAGVRFATTEEEDAGVNTEMSQGN
ncbi:hypothetical protein DMENIID0001_005750 [Sergentomyia squamirostris]